MNPRATYRFQFHKDFTFADAEAHVPYLQRLGISHLYASPITTAVSGSMHGYDVVDPTRINPELGGEEAFRSLVTALRAHGLGIIIDIVPNHMGVAGDQNGWWQDVLARGSESRYARFFDIDWQERLVLPVLGEPLPQALANGVLQLREEEGRFVLVAYDEHRFPIRDEDQADLRTDLDADALRALIDRQHYRLAWWRTANDELNWRRFFTISELAGLQVEDPEVFEVTHALYFRLYGEGLIDGVRVDHVDGLTDPAGYCRRLRDRLDAIERPLDAPQVPAYIVVEKILGPDEQLAQDWGLDGTSGYDFMEQVSAVLHDPAGEAPLTELWAKISGRSPDFAAEELTARQQMLSWAFDGQLNRCVEAFVALAAGAPETAGFTAAMLRRAIARLLWVFPVYRTYGTGSSAPPTDDTIRRKVRARVAPFIPPGEAPVVDAILAWLAGDSPGDTALAANAVRRFQQLSAPIAAKAVEDTAFYRYGRLLSRNDVGFEPARFAASIAKFHAEQAERATSFPRSMLTTATHDHKRGEDVRARLAVLSSVPDAWRDRVLAWEKLAAPLAKGVAPDDRYMLYQTLFGAWPDGLNAGDVAGLTHYADRVKAWQQKALREAKLRSSWEAPDAEYEQRCDALVDSLLDPSRSPDFLADMIRFVKSTAAPALANTLAQTALRYTLPGVPDLYQGCELPDHSLVDPDNRRPVDYPLREQLFEAGANEIAEPGAAKLRLIARLLALRNAEPELFASGSYTPIECRGPRSEHILAFERRSAEKVLRCAVAIRCAPALAGDAQPYPPSDWWQGTTIAQSGNAADLFARSPIWWQVG